MLLYRLLLALALPFLLVRLWLREPREVLRERLGGGAAAPGALWIHAASNGELASAHPLIEALLAQRPGLRLLLTVNTVTARQMAQGWNDPRITVRAAPLDARWILHRFLGRHRPVGLLVIENELWPNRLAICAASGVPVMVAGARMSARSAARWRKTGLGPALTRAITALSAQDPASEAAFLSLGLPRARLLPMLNLKTAVAAPPPTERLDWPRARTVLAASTHEGEEAIVLDAFARARAEEPSLRLILAPRHPRRAAEIARLIAARGLGFTLRSGGEAPTAPVLLADTMGEMANWYTAAGVCFIGGSLVPKGGHTPFEPAAHGCAIVHGPSCSNHAEAFAALDAAGAAIPVTDAATLAQAFRMPPETQARIGQTGTETLAGLQKSGAVSSLARSIIEQIPA
ncbi:3-deoxy-D-manno-octulosonic acid transferase [Paenirhodobacter sp.]|uniref:3-deoxy-D-manno-octulosonic acid transferase n=1 Tax=Paenirhodobacter sp. TaxID=1965326 RepID=UPI003B418DE5